MRPAPRGFPLIIADPDQEDLPAVRLDRLGVMLLFDLADRTLANRISLQIHCFRDSDRFPYHPVSFYYPVQIIIAQRKQNVNLFNSPFHHFNF